MPHKWLSETTPGAKHQWPRKEWLPLRIRSSDLAHVVTSCVCSHWARSFCYWIYLALVNVYCQKLSVCKPHSECELSEIDELVLPTWWMFTFNINKCVPSTRWTRFIKFDECGIFPWRMCEDSNELITSGLAAIHVFYDGWIVACGNKWCRGSKPKVCVAKLGQKIWRRAWLNLNEWPTHSNSLTFTRVPACSSCG